MGDSLDFLPFLRSIDVLRLFPLDLLHTSSCVVHNYRKGSVIVKNSDESEWIVVVKSGSCRVVKTVKIDVEPQENSSVKLPQLVPKHSCDKVNPDTPNAKSMFPSITGTKEKKAKKPEKPGGLDTKRRSVSDSQLPAIDLDKGLINQTQESPFTKSNSDDETLKHKYKKKKNTKPLAKFSHNGHFAQVDLLTEKCVFGFQSLLYEDRPNLTLISNGAECIQISKRFIEENTSPAISFELRKQVVPYPGSEDLQTSLDNNIERAPYKQPVGREIQH